jgi:8-oxo-dGTP pyrophosphatase MutT (NUDIX family)
MLTLHTTGNWPRGAVRATTIPSTRRIVPEVESLIESSWCKGQARLGDRLFDGPMCRLESWSATRDSLELRLSPTSYRIFLGTNLSNEPLAEKFGIDVLANPVGISSVLLTRDGWLLYGRRNASVAYYPDRVHPFAGALEASDLADVFGAVERELNEELKIDPSDIESVRCIGMVEDQTIRQPELVFHTRTHLTRSQIEQQIQTEEHRGSVAIESRRVAVERALADPGEFTPVAIATLLLFGNDVFGAEWFRRTALSLPLVRVRTLP